MIDRDLTTRLTSAEDQIVGHGTGALLNPLRIDRRRTIADILSEFGKHQFRQALAAFTFHHFANEYFWFGGNVLYRLRCFLDGVFPENAIVPARIRFARTALRCD